MTTADNISISPKTPVVKRAWWKESSVYQIYPSSFQDSNGDGIGDIPGIISRLDYFQNLGVDIVWLSPILKSPQVDMGYDISDYYDIHAPYGTREDVDRLIEGLHERGIKYVMDLVVNHTSDQHEWFKQSRSSTENQYRNWYIWRKPKHDAEGNPEPPNNWKSYFGGSAWQLDPTTGEYYLHLFAREQPDLNWENPAVRAAVHDIIRHWLNRGVDGFRMDVINFISKHLDFPDAPITEDSSQPWQDGSMYYACGPRLHEFLGEIGLILKEYDAFSVGEMPCVFDPVEILKAVGFDRHELNMVFQFEIVDIDHGPGGKFSRRKWPLSDLKSIVSKWQTFMHTNEGWNALYLENHDQPRSISRFASQNPEHRTTAGKMLATFLGFQSGTLFIYQGQELGMVNVPETWAIDKFRDIEVLNYWKDLLDAHPNDPDLHNSTLSEIRFKSRDNARTPMQWDSSPHASFTSADSTPWISVNDDFKTWNAASQVTNPDSIFAYWKQVLRLRKEKADIFVYGDYTLIDGENENIFAYTRSFGSMTALVIANFSSSEGNIAWKVPDAVAEILESGRILVANYSDSPKVEAQDQRVIVRPLEAFVAFLDVSAV
ncbi:hypothetical protein AJ80_06823 [Polytolypa hystricis UAMH7299]|uniref:Glycosyl hydrolase family 13 catalytic domain-containing protein n=1 Tax=Polytolypa hystricis (strain UAMH7299) TaxID=1447883 RepID=A0A2B7XTV4_POLH7|nr:hypothetical protein AJ80_06823 [Polytolypa hystricis UAMH7299]